jgi:hypothetical protein
MLSVTRIGAFESARPGSLFYLTNAIVWHIKYEEIFNFGDRKEL